MSLVRGKMVFWNFLLDFEKYGKNLFVSFFVLFLFFVLWHQNFQSFGYIFSYFRKDVFIKTIDCRKKSLKEIPQDLSTDVEALWVFKWIVVRIFPKRLFCRYSTRIFIDGRPFELKKVMKWSNNWNQDI